MEKEAFEPTGLIPRSIIRTVDRFVQQLLPGREKIALQEYRVSRYQILVSIKALLMLVLIPLLLNFTIKALVFTPLIEHFWNSHQAEIFLNQYQEKRAFSEMHDFSEKMFFESLLYPVRGTGSKSKQSPETKYPVLPNVSVNTVSEKAKLWKPYKSSQEPMHELNEITKCSQIFANTNLGRNGKEPYAHVNTGFTNLREPYMPYPYPKGVTKGEVGLVRARKEICQGVRVRHGWAHENLYRERNETLRFASAPYQKANNSTPYPFLQIEESPYLSKELFTYKSPSMPYKRELPVPQRGNQKGTSWDCKALFVRGSQVGDLSALHFVEEDTGLGNSFDNDKYQNLFQIKSLELAKSYNKQSILAITNLLGDFLSFFTLSLLFRAMRPELIILKSFLTESVYSLSDTTKSFLLILGMDLLVGFHSPRGWELALEGFLRHIGLPENENFILLFVALFPVFLDTVFKYWIFRYLNKISPSTVVTYHSMIE